MLTLLFILLVIGIPFLINLLWVRKWNLHPFWTYPFCIAIMIVAAFGHHMLWLETYEVPPDAPQCGNLYAAFALGRLITFPLFGLITLFIFNLKFKRKKLSH